MICEPFKAKRDRSQGSELLEDFFQMSHTCICNFITAIHLIHISKIPITYLLKSKDSLWRKVSVWRPSFKWPSPALVIFTDLFNQLVSQESNLLTSETSKREIARNVVYKEFLSNAPVQGCWSLYTWKIRNSLKKPIIYSLKSRERCFKEARLESPSFRCSSPVFLILEHLFHQSILKNKYILITK